MALDQNITFDNGDEYSLQAIVEHDGEDVHGGHYVVLIRRHGIWEDREDDKIIKVREGKISAIF